VFVGTFEHSLDDKGRVVLPATFRSHLADKGFISQLDDCLGLWTEEGFDEIAQLLRQKVREGQADQDALRAFSSAAAEVRTDTQGRITIPQRLRNVAALDRDVVVIGRIERIEIWDVTRWQAVSTTADESLSQAVRALGL
jgi:MraZ protein